MAAASSGNQEPLLQSTLTRASIGAMKRAASCSNKINTPVNKSAKTLQESPKIFPSRNQSTPQHVKIGDFETEAIDGLLPLAYGAWLCIFGLLMVSLLGAGLIYAAAMLMKDMWCLSYLFFFLFPPLGFALKELRSRLNCQLKEGCAAFSLAALCILDSMENQNQGRVARMFHGCPTGAPRARTRPTASTGPHKTDDWTDRRAD